MTGTAGAAPRIPDSITEDELSRDVKAELAGCRPTWPSSSAGTWSPPSWRAIRSRRTGTRRRHGTIAARIGVVREVSGITAYQTGRWAEALAELRAARRLTGRNEYLALMADAERGLGRLDRALEVVHSDEAKRLPRAAQIELRIVESGIRRDQGLADAAVLALQVPELTDGQLRPWSARLFYAYGDALLAAGRPEAAREAFSRAVVADEDEQTDALSRLDELDGVTVADLEDDEDDDERGRRLEATRTTSTTRTTMTRTTTDEDEDEDLDEDDDLTDEADEDDLDDEEDLEDEDDVDDEDDDVDDDEDDRRTRPRTTRTSTIRTISPTRRRTTRATPTTKETPQPRRTATRNDVAGQDDNLMDDLSCGISPGFRGLIPHDLFWRLSSVAIGAGVTGVSLRPQDTSAATLSRRAFPACPASARCRRRSGPRPLIRSNLAATRRVGVRAERRRTVTASAARTIATAWSRSMPAARAVAGRATHTAISSADRSRIAATSVTGP